MVDQARARRLAKRISQIVADALEHEVKDPRLTMVTITDARVTGDLRDATVYYTVLGRSVDDLPDPATWDPTPEEESDLRERLLRAGEARAGVGAVAG